MAQASEGFRKHPIPCLKSHSASRGQKGCFPGAEPTHSVHSDCTTALLLEDPVHCLLRARLSLLLNAGNTSLVCLRAPEPHAWPRTRAQAGTCRAHREEAVRVAGECHPRRPFFGRRIILNWLFLRNCRQKEN